MQLQSLTKPTTPTTVNLWQMRSANRSQAFVPLHSLLRTENGAYLNERIPLNNTFPKNTPHAMALVRTEGGAVFISPANAEAEASMSCTKCRDRWGVFTSEKAINGHHVPVNVEL